MNGGERRLRKVQTGRYRLNRVFYEELEDGTCNITDVEHVLLTEGIETVPRLRGRFAYLYSLTRELFLAKSVLVAKPKQGRGTPERRLSRSEFKDFASAIVAVT